MEEYKAGDVVRVLSSGEIGAVLRALHNFDTITYEVLVNGEKLILDCTQIRIEKENYELFSTRNELDAVLTSLAINNPGKDLYSLNAANIDFIPYQYRPVLKIIKSDEPRILIADDVGVGKTIEAGLIIKELSARQSMNNIFIFCPRPLVAEGKWKNEMKNKFSEKFQHINRQMLKNAIKECDYEGEWTEEYSKCIIPYSILDEELLTGNEQTGKKELGLLDLKPAPKFDLIIVDEAHHIKNQNTHAYKVIQYFCMHSEAVVFLTATPIQLGNRDLFVLLNLLRPDYILDEETFLVMSEPNPFINKAIHEIRENTLNWKNEAISALLDAKNTEWSNRTVLREELSELIEKITQCIDDTETRVSIISSLEKLHTFSNIINRTRKRDIGNFTVRKPYTVRCKFSESQQRLYEVLIEVQTKILVKNYKGSMIKFLMSTLYRQAASCIFGLAPYIKDILGRHIDISEYDVDYEEDFAEESISGDLETDIKILLEMANDIDDTDEKYNSLRRIVTDKGTMNNNKIMIFSSFRHTLNYLNENLKSEGFRVGLVTGSTKDEDRIRLRQRFTLDKDNNEAVDIMLFSEVGCEGLDYQFCDCMVNYDLPWNPMRIEQRIGRIDRNGQKSESILIYNMITDGTVDADIYDRCLMRIGIFSQSLGCGEEILGSLTKEIQNIVVDYTLTEKEKDEKLRQLADNEVRLINENQVMEENQYDFLSIRMPFDEDKKNLQKATSHWLSAKMVNNILNEYLKKEYLKEIPFINSKKIFEIKFSTEEKNKILSEYYSMKNELLFIDRTWISFLKNSNPVFSFSYDAETAKSNDVCLLGVTHPLVQIASKFHSKIEKKQVVLKYHYPALAGQQIKFAIYEWRYLGERNISQIKIISDKKEYDELLEDMVLNSQVINTSFLTDHKKFSDLHSRKWQEERLMYQARQQKIFERRKESLTLSFQKRLEIIKKQEAGATSTNIIRMKHKEYQNVSEDFDYRIKMLDEQKDKVDIISRFICSGIIKVVDNGY